LTRQTSTYLDFIRFSAALIVFIGHVSGQRMTGGFLWPVAPFMSEAVTIFFVLSGFVIGYVRDRKEASPGAFIVSRAARIYSVAFPALVLTFALDAFGTFVNPGVYNASWGYSSVNQLWQFIAGALFVNRLWFSDVTPGSNLPYWSLGYEVWYYIIFGLGTFLAGWRRIGAVALGMAIAGPQILAMFPLWLLGVGCYRLSSTVRINPLAGALVCIGSTAAWLGYEVWAIRHGRLIGLAPSSLGRPELLQDYLVAACFAGQLLGFDAMSGIFSVPGRLANAVRWTAGATFSLYLFHLPVAQILTAASPWPLASAPNRIWVFGGTLLIAFALAALTERKKDAWRAGLTTLVARVVPVSVT